MSRVDVPQEVLEAIFGSGSPEVTEDTPPRFDWHAWMVGDVWRCVGWQPTHGHLLSTSAGVGGKRGLLGHIFRTVAPSTSDRLTIWSAPGVMISSERLYPLFEAGLE